MKNSHQFPLFKYANASGKAVPPAQSSKKRTTPPPRQLTEKEKNTSFDQFMAFQRAAEKKYGLPNKMLALTVYHESRGDPSRVSNKGAQGVYQILPSVVKKPSEIKNGKEDKTAYYMEDMYDLEESSNAVAKHIADNRLSLLSIPHVDKYKGFGFDKGWELTTLEYIAGRGNIVKWLAAGAPTKQEEIDKLKKLNKYDSKIETQSLARLETMTRELQSGSFNIEEIRGPFEKATGQTKTG